MSCYKKSGRMATAHHLIPGVQCKYLVYSVSAWCTVCAPRLATAHHLVPGVHCTVLVPGVQCKYLVYSVSTWCTV